MVSAKDTGDRQLYIATSGVYSPLKAAGGSNLSSGIPPSGGVEIATGADGLVGSGGYLATWSGSPTDGKKVLKQYREQGVGETVWQYTMGVFKRVVKINEERGSNAGS